MVTSERTVLIPMKKFAFVLLAALALLLCFSTAMAAGVPCDKCGGSTTQTSSGSWCRWYCESCAHTTSRSHDPNSSSSGLSPDSCSGHCRWCGAAANYSSHTFTSWTYENNATCTKDGTEYSICDNVSCRKRGTRTVAGSALGHDYTAQTTKEPGCMKEGTELLTCKRCSHTTNRAVPPIGHFYGAWTNNGDGTHSAACRRDCGEKSTQACVMTEMAVGGKTVSFCSVCGHTVTSGGASTLRPSTEASIKPLDGQKITGRLTVLVDAAPLEADLGPDVLYMITAVLQSGGKTLELKGHAEIKIDLNSYPFESEHKSFADLSPASLLTENVRLMRVVEGENGAEEWRNVIFELDKGILTFKTERMGVYLLVAPNAKAPGKE